MDATLIAEASSLDRLELIVPNTGDDCPESDDQEAYARTAPRGRPQGCTGSLGAGQEVLDFDGVAGSAVSNGFATE